MGRYQTEVASRPRNQSVVTFLHCIHVTPREGHMVIQAERRRYTVTLGGVAARSRQLLVGVAFALSLAFLSFAGAQQLDKVPSVGVLSIAALTSPHYQAFRQGLRDLGYVDGK